MAKNGRTIPHSVVRRLTKYLTYVQGVLDGGEEDLWVSSQELADALGLTSSTVRQDLSHIAFSGTSKKGYEAAPLRDALKHVLGADVVWKAVVVGAGNLGRALALHEDFHRRGFEILGIFDCDPRKIGRNVGDLVVQSMDELSAFVTARQIDIGMIAVPAASAQSVANVLTRAGVHGLLNLALTHVISPESVAVVDSRVVASMLELAHAIRFRPAS